MSFTSLFFSKGTRIPEFPFLLFTNSHDFLSLVFVSHFLFRISHPSHIITHKQVDDQMKLLQNSWSDLLVLDHMHQRMHNGLADETTLANGQKFDLLSLALLGVPSTADLMNQVQNRFLELKLDSLEYLCLKFLLLLNPGKSSVAITRHQGSFNHFKITNSCIFSIASSLVVFCCFFFTFTLSLTLIVPVNTLRNDYTLTVCVMESGKKHELLRVDCSNHHALF